MNQQFITTLSAIAASTSTILLTGNLASAITLNTSVTPIEGGNDFTYHLSLETDETIANATDNFGFPDTLSFENLVGVTDVEIPMGSPYTLLGFDTSSVDLEVATTINGPTTISDAFTITANAFSGDVLATVTFSDANGPNFGDNLTVTGPAAPIPFEAETATGFAAFGMFLAGRKWLKTRQKKA